MPKWVKPVKTKKGKHKNSEPEADDTWMDEILGCLCNGAEHETEEMKAEQHEAKRANT